MRDDDPLWYKDAVIYQTHVKAFSDSNGDGMGDFPGLTEKLPYLRDLGVTALWILPFYPSPLRDDGYDIADYTAVNPSYGTMQDVRTFIREAHRLGLRVITELVINHTSDQHPWFQKSRRAKPGSKWREFYVWTDDPTKYSDTRIIFKDFETSNWTWDPVANAYYWHRFYHHQPDLNFDNEDVHNAIFRALDFWMKLGVDGLRLDAIPYLYEREGTSCENLPETHEYLKKLRAYMDEKHPGKMLLAEANQWPEDTKPYFGDGDECHMAFHFPVMPRLYQSVAIEDSFPIIDIMRQTPPIPDECQWAVFLRNHDELTLEMVTEEDRDFMWRFYAKNPRARINLGIRRRLAPLLGNHRRKIELLNGLLFSLPGTPIIYYGDEIGMGDNIYLGDRNGVRTPMQWSNDRNAGFSRANPQQLYFPVIIDPEYHYESVNVEAQRQNPNSLWWWMRRAINLRKEYRAFGRGSIEFLHPSNRKVLAFTRSFEDEKILVVANLSQHVQYAELDLDELAGARPVEMFGGSQFPQVEKGRPFVLTLGPHEFYWIELRTGEEDEPGIAPPEIPAARIGELVGSNSKDLARATLDWLKTRRWFGAKGRKPRELRFSDWIPMKGERGIAIARIDYRQGASDFYQLPLMIVDERHSDAIVRVGPSRSLIDATLDDGFCRDYVGLIASRTSGLSGSEGEIFSTKPKGSPAKKKEILDATVQRLAVEQSNTSIVLDDRAIVKLFRRLEPGISPDLEIHRFLTQETELRSLAPLWGALEYRQQSQPPATLAMMQRYLPSASDAWAMATSSASEFFETAVSLPATIDGLAPPSDRVSLLETAATDLPEDIRRKVEFVDASRRLGIRIGELHLALSSAEIGEPFAAEPITIHHRQSVHQQIRRYIIETVERLREARSELPERLQPLVDGVISSEGELEGLVRSVATRRMKGGMKIRNHGDLHLGQVLFTGDDFVVIDFEGEPSRALSERRLKRSPLRDVAGMLRSLHYAPHAVLAGEAGELLDSSGDRESLLSLAESWAWWNQVAFLRGWLEAIEGSRLLPETREDSEALLEAFLVEKALYEVNYEMDNRPEWLGIPLAGLQALL